MQLLEVKYLQRRYFTIVWAIRLLGGKQFDRADTVHSPSTLAGWNMSFPTQSPTLRQGGQDTKWWLAKVHRADLSHSFESQRLVLAMCSSFLK